MKYENLFKSLLLENANPTPDTGAKFQQDGQRRHPSGEDAFENSLDEESNPEDFLTKGLLASVEAVQRDFNRRMTHFANTLSPEAVKTMTVGQLKDEINKVYKYIDKIEAFASAKIDALAQDPNAILAAFIASDPAKQRAFEVLHKDIEEFDKSLAETEGALAQLKGKIDDFVSDISGKPDVEAVAQHIATNAAPSVGDSGSASPSGGTSTGAASRNDLGLAA